MMSCCNVQEIDKGIDMCLTSMTKISFLNILDVKLAYNLCISLYIDLTVASILDISVHLQMTRPVLQYQ